MYVKQNDVGLNKRPMEKVHRVLYHNSAKNMEFGFRSAGKREPGIVKSIKAVMEECDICKRNRRSRLRPTVVIPRASDFNSVATLDRKEIGNVYVLWMLCAFTRMMKGVVLEDKRAETVIKSWHSRWL